MAAERPELNRLEVLRALRISNWEAIFSTIHATLTGGAFQTGFALWMGANNLWMGFLGSIPTFAALIQLVSSYFVERRGERKRFTAWYSGISRALWLPILLIPVFLPREHWFAVFTLLFLASSLSIMVPVPAFTSWMSDLVPPDHRGRYFGRRNMLAGITTMIVSLPAAWFLDLAVKRHRFPESVGFGVLFAVAVVAGMLSFGCLWRQPEPPMQRSAEGPPSGLAGVLAFYRAPFAEAGFRRLMAFSAVFAFAQFFAAPFYTVYSLQVLRLDYVWLQVFGTLASLSSLLSMPLWGYLSDKFGNKPLLAIAVFGTGLLPAAWVLTNPHMMGLSLVVICLNNLMGGLFWAGVGLIQFNMLIAGTPAERKSVYVGAMAAVTGIAGGVAPIIGGFVVTALQPVHVAPLGWPMGNYTLVFALNSVLRFSALIALRRVPESSTISARTVLSQLGTAGVGGWMHLRRLQRAPNEDARRQAAQALRASRTALAVEELISALEDPSLHVREEAAEALGDIGDPRAVDALISHLGDAASGIVDEAAHSLGRLRDPRAVAPLARLLIEGERLDRLAAARALGRIGDRAAVPTLVRVVTEGDRGGTTEVVEAAAAALGAIGDPVANAVLCARLDDPSRTMRLTVVRALGEIGHRDAAPALLRLLANETDPAIITHGAVALALMEATDAVQPLLDALDRVASPVARKQMLNAVGALVGDGESFYTLLALDHYGRDEAVSRVVRDLSRRTQQIEPEAFGTKRRLVHLDRALESYLAGDFSQAVQQLARIVDERDVVDGAGAALQWAVETARARSLSAEEWLLALHAVRTAFGRSE